MMRPRVQVLAVLALVACGQLWADGCFVPPSRTQGENRVASTEQKGIIIGLPDGDEVLLLQTTYHGPAAEFAWIIPVPGAPGEDGVFLASQDFIDETLYATKPLVVTEIANAEHYHSDSLSEGAAPPPSDMAPGMAGGPAAAPTVTVHRRMEVGDFDVSVLSATGTQVLLDWLDENGYRTPEGHEEVFGSYVERAWYFVALRILPGVAEDKPTLTDVSPIGIRFPLDGNGRAGQATGPPQRQTAPHLVYPLLISKLSSRPKTAMTLVVMSAQAMVCNEMEAVPPPFNTRHGKGTCWASIRREMAEKSGNLVHEYSGTGDLMWTDLWYRADEWRPSGAPFFHIAHLDRFWGLVALDEMQDLTFAPDPEPEPFRLRIVRRGAVHQTRAERWNRLWGSRYRPPVMGEWLGRSESAAFVAVVIGLLAFGAVLVFALCQRRGARLSGWQVLGGGLLAIVLLALISVIGPYMAGAVTFAFIIWAVLLLRNATGGYEVAADARPSETQVGQWALVLGGFAALMVFLLIEPRAHRPALGGDDWLRARTWLDALLYGLVGLGWAALAVHGVLNRMRVAATSVRVPFLVIWTLASVGGTLTVVFLPPRWPSSYAAGPVSNAPANVLTVVVVVVLAAMAAVAAFMLVGGFAGERARAGAQLLAQGSLATVMLAIIIAFGGAVANAGMGGYIGTGYHALDQALADLDEALTAFAEDTGCYPATLADLTRRSAPGQGLDSSGNPVPMGSGFAGPYLDGLPRDPLTARSDTWLYEATGSPIIDSGGFRLEFKRNGPGPTEVDAISEPRPYYGTLMGYPLQQKALQPEVGVLWAVVSDGYQEDRLVQTNPSQGWARISRGPEHGTTVLGVSGSGAQMFACKTHYQAVFQPSVVPVDGSGPPRKLTPGPWAANITDVSANPRGKGWVVVAREMDPREARAMGMGVDTSSFSEPCAFILDGEHMPRKVEGSEGAIAARFAPNGRDVLVMVADETSGGGDARGARLLRVSPDGSVDEVGPVLLAQHQTNFVSSAWGAAWSDLDGTIVLEDPQGGQHLIAPPQASWRPADIWVGPGTVLAAYMGMSEQMRAGRWLRTWRSEDAALVLLDLATGATEELGQIAWVPGRATRYAATIVGYDPTVPAAVFYRRGSHGSDNSTVMIIQKRDGTWYPPAPMATR